MERRTTPVADGVHEGPETKLRDMLSDVDIEDAATQDKLIADLRADAIATASRIWRSPSLLGRRAIGPPAQSPRQDRGVADYSQRPRGANLE